MTTRQGPTQAELDRLTADLRVFDGNGIERGAGIGTSVEVSTRITARSAPRSR